MDRATADGAPPAPPPHRPVGVPFESWLTLRGDLALGLDGNFEIACFDLCERTERWRHVSSLQLLWADDARAYLGAIDREARPRLTVRDLRDGARVADVSLDLPPLVDEDYGAGVPWIGGAVATDGHLVLGIAPHLVSVELATGRRVAATHVELAGWFAVMASAYGVAYALERDPDHRDGPHLVSAHEPTTLRRLWRTEVDRSWDLLATRDTVVAYARRDPNKHAERPDGRALVLDASRGVVLWDDVHFGYNAAAQGDLLYLADGGGGIVARELLTGRERWCVHVGSAVHAMTAAGSLLYVRCDDGALLALDARNGEPRWGARTESDYGLPGALAASDTHLAVATMRGSIEPLGELGARARPSSPSAARDLTLALAAQKRAEAAAITAAADEIPF